MKQGGDIEEEIVQLYDTYSSALYSFIIRIIGDEVKAKKILQTVFIKACKNIEAKHNPVCRFVELLNISRNEAIETLIRINCDRRVNVTNEISLPTNSVSIHSVLINLPLCEKTILSLIYYRQFTPIEIADLLKLSMKFIQSKMQSALQQLDLIDSAPKGLNS